MFEIKKYFKRLYFVLVIAGAPFPHVNYRMLNKQQFNGNTLPAILRSRILRQSCSAFLIGQFSTLALKLLKNLYSLKCDMRLSILLWCGGGEGAFDAVDTEDPARTSLLSADLARAPLRCSWASSRVNLSMEWSKFVIVLN